MSEYWKETMSEILSAHGFVFTSEKLGSIAGDVASAASVEIEYSSIAESVKDEVNPLAKEVDKLQKSVDALCQYYGIGFDSNTLEICVMAPISSSHSASHRIRIGD